MKIYTKAGDDGSTGLIGPGRVGKDDLRIEAYGTVDELNAVVGTLRALGLDPGAAERLDRVQRDLFSVGSALAEPDPAGRFQRVIAVDHVARLEAWIDDMDADLPALTAFVLPVGSPAATQAHLARTVCRRAERAVVRLARRDGTHVEPAVIAYLNRLSDTLFVLARWLNQRAGVGDRTWEGP